MDSISKKNIDDNEYIAVELQQLGITELTSSAVIQVLKEKENLIQELQQAMKNSVTKCVPASSYSKLIEVPMSREERLGHKKRMSYNEWKCLPKNLDKSPVDCLIEVWGGEIKQKKLIQRDLLHIDKPLLKALRNYFYTKNKHLNEIVPTVSQFHNRFSGNIEDYKSAYTLYQSIKKR